MTKEERKVCEISDGNVSAGSTSNAHPGVEVKDELGRITDQYHSLTNGHQEFSHRAH